MRGIKLSKSTDESDLLEELSESAILKFDSLKRQGVSMKNGGNLHAIDED